MWYISFGSYLAEVYKCLYILVYLSQYLSSPPCSYQEKTVVVSCDANKAVCQRTLDGNIPVVSAEFLLTGILRQEVELDQYPLTIEPMSSTWY